MCGEREVLGALGAVLDTVWLLTIFTTFGPELCAGLLTAKIVSRYGIHIDNRSYLKRPNTGFAQQHVDICVHPTSVHTLTG